VAAPPRERLALSAPSIGNAARPWPGALTEQRILTTPATKSGRATAERSLEQSVHVRERGLVEGGPVGSYTLRLLLWSVATNACANVI
jgi:hypothetical protein